MEFKELLEILLLGAITIRFLVLYKRMKLYHQMNRHIEETEISLEKLDKTLGDLNLHILNVLKHTHIRMGNVNHKKGIIAETDIRKDEG